MRLSLLALLFAAVSSHAAAVQDAPHPLQGTWQLISLQDGGRTAPDEVVQGVQWIVTETQITQTGGEAGMQWTYSVDDAPTPKWLDLKQGTRVTMGIYKIEDDLLTVCMPEGQAVREKARSTAFESKAEGPNDNLLVFRRSR